mmetsp:Transcript_57378/g.125659  ORF Transcript_57378/g.125659 Transcript_57378/m.125659 type:complete len:118 (-) Transcript_57378:5-358(-)
MTALETFPDGANVGTMLRKSTAAKKLTSDVRIMGQGLKAVVAWAVAALLATGTPKASHVLSASNMRRHTDLPTNNMLVWPLITWLLVNAIIVGSALWRCPVAMFFGTEKHITKSRST